MLQNNIWDLDMWARNLHIWEIIRSYYDQLYTNKSDNLDEMENP